MAARRILPGSTYLVTRRCRDRQFFLTPSKLVSQILLYCLFCAARQFNIRIHAYCFMSNHYHLLLTDCEAKLPRFMKWFNERVTKCLNRVYGRRGSLWDPDSKYNAVEVRYEQDIIDKLVYVHANPVAAGLVPRPSQWIGERSLPEDVGGRTLKAKRPEQYFSGKTESQPREIEYRLDIPPALKVLGYDVTKYRQEVTQALKQAVLAIHEKLKIEGRKFVGRDNLCYHWEDRAKRPDPEPSEIVPTLACKDRELRIEMIKEIRAFRIAYSDARQRLLAGETDVEFPPGTYWLRVHLGVRCQNPPTLAA